MLQSPTAAPIPKVPPAAPKKPKQEAGVHTFTMAPRSVTRAAATRAARNCQLCHRVSKSTPFILVDSFFNQETLVLMLSYGGRDPAEECP
jgi:hypothetical protein